MIKKISLRKINESKDVDINDVGFTFYVDTDPLRGRFIARTSKDLDHLSTDEQVGKMVKAMEAKLLKATNIKWVYDSGDPGAGYSFIPDLLALAEKLEKSL